MFSCWCVFREDRIRNRMERFRQARDSRREEREKERAAGRSRQTRMEDFFRVTRKRDHVSSSQLHTKCLICCIFKAN